MMVFTPSMLLLSPSTHSRPPCEISSPSEHFYPAFFTIFANQVRMTSFLSKITPNLYINRIITTALHFQRKAPPKLFSFWRSSGLVGQTKKQTDILILLILCRFSIGVLTGGFLCKEWRNLLVRLVNGYFK